MQQPETTLKERPIFIMGMYRSGTSMIAEVVHRWGAYGGDLSQLGKSDPRNPRGFWESDLIQDFSVTLFPEKLRSMWHPDFALEVRKRAAELRFRDEANRIVGEMAQHNPIWFWKEPYLSLLLPFWKEILGDITCIILVRDPYESALSWQQFLLPKDQGYDERVSIIAANLLRWQFLMLTALGETHDNPHKIFISYEQFLADPVAQSRRLAAFLEQQYGRPADAATITRMVEAVSRDLRRSKSTTAFAEVAQATAEQKALYEFLLAKVDDPELEFVPERYPLFPGWREYLMNVDIFRDYHGVASRLLARPTVRAAIAVETPFRLLGPVYRGVRRRLAS